MMRPTNEPEKPYICETCGKKLAKGMGIELPQSPIAKAGLEGELVEDPACLRFCSKRCQNRWGALRQGAIWKEHKLGCMCAECL